jgi:hypothetical protein
MPTKSHLFHNNLVSKVIITKEEKLNFVRIKIKEISC